MGRTRFEFRHHTTVAASPAQVRAVLLDLEHYPRWWPQVRAVARLGPDDALVIVRSWLPYDLELAISAQRREGPDLVVGIEGDMSGWARWSLHPVGPARRATRMDYRQEVRVNSPLLAAACYVARPLLIANHEAMMRGADRGLGDLFGAEPVRLSS